jgi:hypothetical protein
MRELWCQADAVTMMVAQGTEAEGRITEGRAETGN